MMLDVALGYKEVFPNMKLKDKNYVCLPSENDWKIAHDICKKLKMFYELTAFFSGTAYPTANEFFFSKIQTENGRVFFGIIYAPLGDEEVKLAIKNVDDFFYALFTEYVKKRSVENDKETCTFSTTSGGDSNDSLSQYDEYVKEKQDGAPSLERSEYDKNEPVKPWTPDFDVLAWWKVNARDFPTLALIARDVLAIPVVVVDL
ncbi:zinc finger BED domain-containing protein RICESLEEPER 3-like [Rutidosis leptorrhynchoides]|uniref:zinc finger BED domain-containing protein RICESLEEPER 3-like n=1 Tax=Rutidosis leptorrhynchoides TaxID=125765 RepID=UPI003A9A1A46